MTPEKLTPLPWFAFNVQEYLADTMRLTTESHGAYLLLILDYYARGEPCPDDDFILAATVKLSEEAWKRHRKVLAPFFDIREGYWFHKRIEREMQAAMLKHSASVERAKAGAAAMHAKRAGKEAKTPSKRARSAQAVPAALPQAMPTAVPKQGLKPAQEHKHPSITEGGESSPAPEGDQSVDLSPIPSDFLPEATTSDRASAAGMTVAEIDSELVKFRNNSLAKGHFSRDWQASFAVWIERQIEFRAKAAEKAEREQAKAPPRIEVSNSAAALAAADAATWDGLVARYARNNSQWSRQFGPEPGMAGCKCPPHILEKHGWDPKLKRFIPRAS
jgi:uncharacterized protein YdaU (DUF1376 family)